MDIEENLRPVRNSSPKHRRDGWTAARREAFFGALREGSNVRRACARIGLSREGAYRLRARDAGFARAWDAAQRSAGATDEALFLALLAERVPALAATVSKRIGEAVFLSQDRVTPGPRL